MSPDHRPYFQQQQYAFTARIRDPQRPTPDGVEQRRMDIYTELFFNNINEQLCANFPVIRKIMDDDSWRALVRNFMIRHQCSTSLFTKVGEEFIEYLQLERNPEEWEWPFMLELAHYEYMELAVAISTADEGISDFDPNGDLLTDKPLIAPTAINLSYQFPVHKIGPEFLPEEPPEQPTHLVIYRDRKDDVHFLEINAVTQRLLQLIQENPELTGEEILQQIARELQHPQPETVIDSGTTLLSEMRERNVILGTRS